MSEHFFKYEFVYIFLFCSLFFLGFSIIIKQKLIKLSCFLVFSVFITLSISEIILYSQKSVAQLNIPKKFAFDKVISENNVIAKREVLLRDRNNNNYKIKHYSDMNKKIYVNEKKVNIVYDVCYSFLSDEFRYTKSNSLSDNIYIFLGCSFTFGTGINDNETLPYCFSKSMKFKNNVLNFGIPSRGSTTALNILRNDIVDKFTNDKHVKVFIYSLIASHSDRNFNVLDQGGNDNWILENGKWQRLKQPFGKIKIIFARSYIFKKIFAHVVEMRNSVFYKQHLLKDLKIINEIIKEKYNSHLTIIVWPDCVLDEYLFNSLQKLNFDIIVLPKYFDDQTYRIKGNNHPNAKANEEIANILMKHLNNKNKI